MKKLLASLLALALPLSSAQAVPQVLNFQGRLSESGSLSSGSRQITFRIYASQTGGTALFTENRTIAVSSGIFNSLIGEVTPGGIPLLVFDGNDRYVEVQVGTTVLPRQKMASVAHAYVAAVAQSLATGATIQFSTLNATNVSATFVSADDARFLTLTVGTGTIVVGGPGGAGLGNTISISATAQGTPQIRTSAAGNLNLNNPAPTGANPLIINAGASGNLFLNPFTSGNILLARSSVTNTGSFILAPNASLSLFGPTGTITTASSVTASAFFGDFVDARSARFGTGVNQSLFSTLGALTFPAGYTPAAPQEAATKAYVDSQVDGGIWTKTGSVIALANPTDNVVVQSTLTVQGNEFSVGSTLLNVSGDNVGIGTTGPAAKLDVTGNAQFGSGAAKSTFTAIGALHIAANSDLRLTGPAGNVIGQASVTASGFFGDGSGLTGISASQLAAANVTPGTFVSGVNLPAAGVLPGSLGSTVIASSIAVSAVSDNHVAAGANIAQAKIANLIPDLLGKVSRAGDTMSGSLGVASIYNHLNSAMTLSGHSTTVNGQNGGILRIQGGDGNASNTQNGGDLELRGGNTASTNQQGGAVTIQGGEVVLGQAGSVLLTGGRSSNGNGGDVTIRGGTNSNVGGNLVLMTGHGSSSVNGTITTKIGNSVASTHNDSSLAFAPNYDLSLSGPAGYLTTASSINASAFFGDGSHLTGISGPWNKIGQKVELATPTDYVVVQTTLTVQGNEFSVGSSLLKVFGGNVGIGTTAPGHQLHVIGSVCVDDAIGGTECPAADPVNTSIAAQTAITANAFDLAERFEPEDIVEPGDVVIASDRLGKVLKSNAPNSPKVLGVVSSQPGFLLGFPSAGVPIAMVGRVPVKASAENGPIQVGDLLVTSSKPGYAMRAGPEPWKQTGAIIGKALEPLESGEGSITVFVMPK